MQSDSVLCLVIILADCYCGARTHLEFERLMPKGANFAQAAHPPWVILAARPLHVWKTFYGYYQKFSLYLYNPRKAKQVEILIKKTYGNLHIRPPRSHNPCGSRKPISEIISIM